jgi:multiple sugar transport system substrate-binding protein
VKEAKKLRTASVAKRWPVAVLTTALIAAGVAGCSGGAASTEPTSTGAASGKVTIWVGSWWEPNVPKLQDAWKKDHPEITLDIQPLPINNYPDKFTSAALGGDPPDVIDLDVGMLSTIAAKNLLQPMDDFVKQEKIDPKTYASAVWTASTFKGVQYGVPDHAYSSFLYYNKTLFDQAGLAYPTASWDYDAFLKDAQTLTSGDVSGFGMAADLSDPANAMDFIGQCIWGHGGDFFNKDQSKASINSDEAVAGLQYWADLYTKYKVVPSSTPNFTVTRDVVPLFEAGKVAMVTQGAQLITEFAKHPDVNYGMVTLPDKVNRGGGWTMGIPVGAKNPDAAKVFLKWFSDPTTQGTFMPTTPALIDANAIEPWNAPQYDVSTAAFADSKSLPQVANWTPMQVAIVTELQKVLVGQETVKQAADKLEDQLNSLLKS